MVCLMMTIKVIKAFLKYPITLNSLTMKPGRSEHAQYKNVDATRLSPPQAQFTD